MNTLKINLELWPRQLEAFHSPATEQLFGGASEGGKSHYARILLISACLGVPHLQTGLVRKKFSDIINNHVESGSTGFRSLLAPLTAIKQCTITQDDISFANGSRIVFTHCQDERQFDSAQGIERHLLVIDEATQISERLIRFFRTWVRMPREMKALLPEFWKEKLPGILYTANPIGISVGFFRRNFVKAREAFAIEEVDGFKRQYIPSRYTDNLSVDEAAHKGRLSGIGDEQLAKALDLGTWDAMVGEFYPEYDEARHVVSDFTPPHWWFRFRAFDWGTAEPFACIWCAVSDGQPFRDEINRERWYPAGALIVYQEWYGCDDSDPSKGNRMRNEDIATGIINRTEYDYRNIVTLTDSLPFQDRGGETIAETFRKSGCTLTLGDTSRIPGWSQLRSRLIGKQIDSNDKTRTPMIFLVESCRFCRDYLPALSRHPSEAKREDAVEHGEATHICDSLRLACMAHTVIKHSTVPMNIQIKRELASQRPTIKKLIGGKANAYFN